MDVRRGLEAVPGPLARLIDTEDVLACMSFPPPHRTKLHSTNPLERLHGEVERRAGLVGIFLDEDAITRLLDALLLESLHDAGKRDAIERRSCRHVVSPRPI